MADVITARPTIGEQLGRTFRALHHRDAVGHFALQLDRQLGQQRRRLFGPEMGQHQRDGLGMLVDQEGQQLRPRLRLAVGVPFL